MFKRNRKGKLRQEVKKRLSCGNNGETVSRSGPVQAGCWPCETTGWAVNQYFLALFHYLSLFLHFY